MFAGVEKATLKRSSRQVSTFSSEDLQAEKTDLTKEGSNEANGISESPRRKRAKITAKVQHVEGMYSLHLKVYKESFPCIYRKLNFPQRAKGNHSLIMALV